VPTLVTEDQPEALPQPRERVPQHRSIDQISYEGIVSTPSTKPL
jgi:hypothetical protein